MFLYKPNFIPTSFIVIGAGGTGSRFVPLLAQFLKTATWLPNPRLSVIDFDIVEEKNLVRQNFIKLDLNKPKAVVLAERYSKAFDINIIPVVKKVEKSLAGGQFRLDNSINPETGITQSVTLETLKNAIIILCVDSAEARKNILNRLMMGGSRNILVLDAGNENDYGQILIFNDNIYCPSAYYTQSQIEKLPLEGGLIPFDVNLNIIPYPIEFYEDMKDTTEKSCAELDQTLAINATMATSMMGIIQNFLYQKTIPYHKLNISLSHGAIPEYITLKYLIKNMYYIKKNKHSIYSPVPIDPHPIFSTIVTGIEKFKNGQTNKKEASKKSIKKEVETTEPVEQTNT